LETRSWKLFSADGIFARKSQSLFTEDGVKKSLALSVCLVMSASHAIADPLMTMDQVGKAIMACWQPPAGATKSSVTLSFSFNRDGALIGPPMSTAIDVAGDGNDRKQFVDAAISAVNHCTPVELSPDLAQGIGGQVFTMEFATADRSPTMNSDN
jgi:hypothetical protein